ncbi:MAG TPA: YdeI/OmpD-associated family protein [Bacteroidia bacterium]|nr:YdeI/OmpD-associated family protein [Bacteroidia bacterium]
MNLISKYIQGSEVFARPILNHLRTIVNTACPEADETIKWNCPHFVYKNKIICSFAAFKSHCAFTLRLADKLHDPKNILQKGSSREAMGHLGRITKLSDLPAKGDLIKFIRESKQLIDSGNTSVTRDNGKLPVASAEMPQILLKSLNSSVRLKAAFEKLPPSHKKEYILYINEAKKEETRIRRLNKVIAKLK